MKKALALEANIVHGCLASEKCSSQLMLKLCVPVTCPQALVCAIYTMHIPKLVPTASW